MSFLEIDAAPESELPAHTNDGKRGDRVSFLEGGLLHVESGRATFAQWADVLGIREHEGDVYVLVPRRPPSPPWIQVTPEMIGGESPKAFIARLEERGTSGGGYRDAVRTRRQNLTTKELRDRIVRHDPVPGALEVPSTIMLGVSYPGLGPVQGTVFFTFGGAGFVAMEVISVAPQMNGGDPSMVLVSTMAGYAVFFGMIVAGAALTMFVGKKWREAKNKTLPRQRVLVLAPDGCIVGFSSGVSALSWSEVGSFEAGISKAGEDALFVRNPDGRLLGEMDAGWLDAPLSLVVKIAETYRQAATDE